MSFGDYNFFFLYILQYGINCHAGELLKSFVLGISRMIREEKAVYGQISDEEWEAIRPTKRERKDTILNFMRGFLKENSKCSNCTTWRMQSGESWGNVYDTKFSSLCKYLKEDS